MLKILAWIVSNDGRLFKGAVNILERQNNGVELIGITANVEISISKDGKKVAFVPFKSDLDSAWYINPDVQTNSPDFVDKVNQFGIGHPFYYDVFDMLLYGKKTPLINM